MAADALKGLGHEDVQTNAMVGFERASIYIPSENIVINVTNPYNTLHNGDANAASSLRNRIWGKTGIKVIDL
jgi:hypothetical protein